MGIGVVGILTSQKEDQSGAPFAPGSANNGLSIDAGGMIVLGNDVGGSAGQLLSNREISTNGFALNFLQRPDANTQIGFAGPNLLLYQGTSGNSLVCFQTRQGKTATGVQPYGNFWVDLDEAFINADGQRDAVLEWGYNQGPGGNVNEATFHLAIESHFIIAGDPNFEFHITSSTYVGSTNRHLSMNVSKTTGFATSFWQMDTMNWFPTGGSSVPYFSLVIQGIAVLQGTGSRLDVSNTNPNLGQLRIDAGSSSDIIFSNSTAGATNLFQFNNGLSVTGNFALLIQVGITNSNTTALAISGSTTASGGFPLIIDSAVSASGGSIFRNANTHASGAAAIILESTSSGDMLVVYRSGVNASDFNTGYSAANNDFRVTSGLSVLLGGTNHITIKPAKQIGIAGTTAPTAWLHIAAGTATASTAPLKLTSGVNLTTGETGAIEYNGTNLFFTRTGTTRETVLTGNSGAAAPGTTAGVAITNFYGTAATNYLGDPNSWASVVIGGTTFKIPLYT